MNDLVKKESNELVEQNVFSEYSDLGLGAGDDVDNDDIIIPKILLLQPLSDAVMENKAQAGNYYTSVEGEVLGDKVEIIVLKGYKRWQEFKLEGNQKEYIQTIDYFGNEDLPYDDEENNIHRDLVLGYYVLLVDELKQGNAFPYAIDFKRTSRKAGKQLATYFAKLRKMRRPSFSKVFTLGVDLVKDEHTYYVKTVSAGRDVTKEEAPLIIDWVKEFAQNADKYKEDDKDDTIETTAKPVETSEDDLPF